MKNSTVMIIICCGLISAFSQAETSSAESIKQLLMQVKLKQQQDIIKNTQREAIFVTEKSKQKSILFNGEKKFAEVKKQNQPLIEQSKTNQAEIKALTQQLDNEIAALGDIYSVLNQFSLEVNTQLTESMTHGQFPQRQATLDAMQDKQNIPDLSLIANYWLTLQHEMTNTGNVDTFTAPVIDTQGVTQHQKVTRIGTFTAFSHGHYLQWLPLSKSFRQLQRQPESDLIKIAKTFSIDNHNIQPTVIDPSQGKLLALNGEKAKMTELIQAAGNVGYIILALGAVGLILTLYRFIYLFAVQRQVKHQLSHFDEPKGNNPLGRVILAARSTHTSDSRLEFELDEAVLKEVMPLERGLGFLKVLIGVAPLLGLLGTITGMIETFQLMSLYGSGDAKLMSSGISQALVTTALGLIVAIPLLFSHNIIATRNKRIVHLLDEQSAGLMARFLEKIENVSEIRE
ncbi:MAG: MotA/TolQ/ExbB proton channel family protein [Alteromonadaceae bacterium]|nr:MotA/TolQ/ExbB proton channel family protein [Alteromonadaceae bacterium]